MTRVVTSNHALASSVGGRSSAPAGIIKLAEIKEYDGRGDVNSFLFQVEDVYSLFPNLSDEQKIVSASVRLTGLAQSWYRSARADTTLTWESFKTGLKAAFKSKSEAAKARDILHDAKQKHNQTALSFATHLRGLFLQIPNITDDEQLDRFRRGLHPALRAMVDVQLPDSFDKAVNIAVAHDSAYRDAGVSTATPMQLGALFTTAPPRGRHFASRQHTPSSAPSSTAENRSRPATHASEPWRKLTPEEREQYHKNNRCTYCREFGHVISDCKRPSRKPIIEKIATAAVHCREDTSNDQKEHEVPLPAIEPRFRITKLTTTHPGDETDSTLLVFLGSYKGHKPRQFIIRDNLLYHTGRGSVKLYIPVGPLRTDLLCEAHSIPISGHLGRDKTYARLSRFYFWPRMAASVHDYVRTCLACQRNKSNTQRPIGLLQSLPVPQHRWEHVSLDLITQLPVTTSGHDAIVVFVDKLTKMIHAIPTTTSVTASTLARIFFDHVFRLHGLPKVIVSDRDPRFTSAFWQELFKLTGTHLNMSTANHPQTDGQTERANRTLEDMLRNYVSPHHDDWDQHLTAAEFAYNASVQASTGYTPFRLNSGQEPYTPLTLSVPPSAVQGDSESASGFLQRMARDIASATHNLVKAQERQTTYANKKRRDHTFKEGDMVYLAHSFFAHTQPANVTAENATRKFLPRQHGPFKVLEVVTPVALRLQFPPAWSTMHPVVHVSHIKLHNDGSAEFPTRNPNPPPEPEIIDGEEHFEVQEIRNHRFVRGKLQLQVKWLGHPDHENSWLPLEHLQEDLTKTFLKKIMKAYAIRTNQPKRWTQPAARA
ncbi:hypothetical protein QJQ45_030377 [Haematococcus lacustris]|nr:hypothetical protein QJQ45_030377 [Haematococcus lacustris]